MEQYFNFLVKSVRQHLGIETLKPIKSVEKPRTIKIEEDLEEKSMEFETQQGDLKKTISKDGKVRMNKKKHCEANYLDDIISKGAYKYPELNKFLAQFNKNIINMGVEPRGNVAAFIDELHKRWSGSLQNYPVHYEGTVFLSYNHPDQGKAKTLKQLLRARGVRNVWFDIDDLNLGEHQPLIREEIIKCKVFIPLISNNSLNNNQSYMWRVEWATIEMRLHADKYYGKLSFQIIPVILDNTARNDERIPEFMRGFTMWDLDKNKDRIIEEITKILTPIMKKQIMNDEE